MYRRNWGDQIRNVVENAIHSMDYDNLNKTIRDVADRAIDEFNHVTGKNNTYYDNSTNYNYDQNNQYYGTRNHNYNGSWQQSDGSGQQTSFKNINSFKPVLMMLSGVLGVIGFGSVTFILLVFFLVAGLTKFLALTIVLALLTSPFIALIVAGNRKRHWNSRCRTYFKLTADHQCCAIEKLADAVKKTEKFVVKDLQKMIEKGMYPEGHIDSSEKYFILGDTAYAQFCEAQNSYKERQKQEQMEQEQLKGNEALAEAVAKGKTYIEGIREINRDIPGEEISRKLDRLEDVVRRIFLCIQKKPEKLSGIDRLMDYYLPTTDKLLRAYREFDQQTVQGDNIIKSKQEIENSIDTIIDAYEKLFDSLYDKEAMDISSDISVLNTMFAQDGLTENAFENKEDK